MSHVSREQLSPGRRLRDRIVAAAPAQAMAAHSPLSARLAHEAGFDALWASGFELSALHGLPDISLIGMAEHLASTRAICEATPLPVIADIDTGFGNALNVIHAIEQYERAGVAAVVIEDKTFPKVTSLVAGGRQELLRREEFQGKIEAACATRRDPDMLIIARTEALIAGLGESEALARASAYREAGANMILVHSKSRTPDEIESFARGWRGDCPLVVVPTAYPDLTVARMREVGRIGLVIWGNHALRAAVTAMQDVFRRVLADGGIHNVDRDIVPVEEIFRLQDMARVKRDEQRFLR